MEKEHTDDHRFIILIRGLSKLPLLQNRGERWEKTGEIPASWLVDVVGLRPKHEREASVTY